jgi:hypothetical protein
MATEDERQTAAGLAQRADAAEPLDRRTGHRREKAAPGKNDGHPIGDSRKLARQRFGAGPNVDEVGEAGAERAAGELPDARGVRVNAYEEPVRLGARPLVR